jgi:hypothetical protein
MIQGIDYSMGMPSSAALRGFDFACRYTGYTSPGLPQSKILTLAEAKDISYKGLSIVSNFEWYANRPNEGWFAGEADAHTAMQYHAAAGGPKNAALYFSVDFLPADLTPIGRYFQGIASVMDLEWIGGYGPYKVIKYLREQNLISWCWQTYAWSTDSTGTYWYEGNHIEQYHNGVALSDGTVVDLDRAMFPQFGQWSLQGDPPKFMENQFNAVWYSDRSGVPAGYKSGIYSVVLAGFLSFKYSACFPTSNEIATTDWQGNQKIYQTLSNGHHCEYSDGTGRVYDGSGKLVWSSSI